MKPSYHKLNSIFFLWIMGLRVLNFNETDFIFKTGTSNEGSSSKFDDMFQTSWNDAKHMNNYDVSSVITKILPGKYNIVAQLNPKRAIMRRPPAAFKSIKQPFNPNNFNFTKIFKEEILFQLNYISTSCDDESCVSTGNKTSATVILNTSPITPFHCLLLPEKDSCLPQIIDKTGLFYAVASVLLSASPYLKVGMNSLGAMASVNHYHFHIYYLLEVIYVQKAACEHLAGPVFIFKDHYTPGFIFQLKDRDVIGLLREVMVLIDYLLKEEICHNVVITRGFSLLPLTNKCSEDDGDNVDCEVCEAYDTVRVCVWARTPCYGAKNCEGNFSSGLCEMSGHLPLYGENVWDSITEGVVVSALQEVSEQPYKRILPEVKALFAQV